MNKLSIESINAKTPYQVKFKQETSSYLFTSESNVDYAVDFTLASNPQLIWARAISAESSLYSHA